MANYVDLTKTDTGELEFAKYADANGPRSYRINFILGKDSRSLLLPVSGYGTAAARQAAAASIASAINEMTFGLVSSVTAPVLRNLDGDIPAAPPVTPPSVKVGIRVIGTADGQIYEDTFYIPYAYYAEDPVAFIEQLDELAQLIKVFGADDKCWLTVN